MAATNFLVLTTILKTFGAKWLPEKKVNFTLCTKVKKRGKVLKLTTEVFNNKKFQEY